MSKSLIRIGLIIIAVCVIVAIPICRGRINSAKLFVAMNHNDIAQVKSLLDKGVNVNAKNKYGIPLLHQSVVNNNTQLAQLLLDNGADISIKQKKLNVKINRFNSYNIISCTALHVAVSNNNLQMTKLLLENGSDVNAKSGKFETSRNNCSLDDSGAFFINGATVLQMAVFGQNLEMTKLLLEHGAEINIPVHQYGFSAPLNNAVGDKNMKLIKLLLENGANVNYENYCGRTPLIVAVESNPQTDIVKLLLEYGADVNAKNPKNGFTPLHIISQYSTYYKFNPEIADLLLDNGADINAVDNMGSTPLFIASWFSNKEVVKFLISRGADLNAKNRFGETALYNLSERGKTDLVQILLDAGADANIKTNRGETALDIAIQRNRTNLIELLRKHGAKTGAQLGTGNSLN